MVQFIEIDFTTRSVIQRTQKNIALPLCYAINIRADKY